MASSGSRVSGPSIADHFDEYVETLKDGVREVASRLDGRLESWESRAWTLLVARVWGVIGTRAGFEVFSRKRPAEFVVDLCWFGVEADSRWMQLALECEWGSHGDAFLWDFRKLIHVNALEKVFIFDEKWSRLGWDGYYQAHRLAAEVRKSRPRSSDESYLLIWHRAVSADREEVVSYTIRGDGQLSESPAKAIVPITVRRSR
ncbi:MAG: hypothetical protein HY678_06495 [Chloroflexi bacterium]|nr:hypothetical protein [Chloroflexota bacterium]